jgi:thiamine-triphosphatase
MLNVSTGGRHVFPRISCHFSKIASTYSGKVQIRRLEVECKFLVTLVAISYLRSNSRGSRFKQHESLGKQTMQDTYYDRNALLFSKGVYIRQRNGHWEAKICTGGDFINLAFTEVNGNNIVKEVIK